MIDLRQQIRSTLAGVERSYKTPVPRCTLSDYACLARNGVWTQALQRALDECGSVHIPAGLYLLDGSVLLSSHCHIVAEEGAVLRLTEETDVLMLRNRHVTDGTRAPEGAAVDEDISITGGRWEESRTGRMGYGKTGKFDAAHSIPGCSTCMLFAGVRGLRLRNMTFAHAAGFAVQIGNATDVVCTDIRFEDCYADGLHINGNTHRVLLRDIAGRVGDDLVALNAYDWDTSSLNFGPITDVVAERLVLFPGSPYRALRVQPGVYVYADGQRVDCALRNILFSHVRGVKNFKLYLQTRPYLIGGEPAPTGVGSGDHLYFEDIEVKMDGPIDALPDYVEKNPVTGWLAAFEVGANIGQLWLENVKLTVHPDWNQTALLLIGPKSARRDGREIFDPYVSCWVKETVLRGVTLDGVLLPAGKGAFAVGDIPAVKEITFPTLYPSPLPFGHGKVGSVTVLP